MHEQESDEIGRQDKMHGTRRLAAVEERDEPRKGGVESGRHRQPRQNEDREGDDDAEIGKLLQHIVVQRLFSLGKAQPRMIGDRARDRTEIVQGRHEIANVPAGEEVHDIDQAIQHEQPGEEEVPAPAHGEVLFGRQGGPGRESALLHFAVRPARGAEQSGRIKRAAEDRRHPGDRVAIVVFAGGKGQERMLEIRRLSPA